MGELAILAVRSKDGVRSAKMPLLFSIALALAGVGCATVIRPPEDPPDPVNVLLVDYGYHSSLILPEGERASTEYAYGQWDYFALNKDDLWHGLLALLCPSQGTIGRRDLAVPAELSSVRSKIRCQEIHALTVSRAAADDLRAKLNERIQRHLDTAVSNDVNGLTFVQDDETYICFHNCNHAVLEWLLDLGCDIKGCGWFANFEVEVLKHQTQGSRPK